MYLIEAIGVALAVNLLTEAIVLLIRTKSEDRKQRMKIFLLLSSIVVLLTLGTYWLISIWNSPYRIQILPILLFTVASTGIIFAFKTIKQSTQLFIAVIIFCSIMAIGVFLFGKNYSTLQQSKNDPNMQGTELQEPAPSTQEIASNQPSEIIPTTLTPEPTETQTSTPSPSVTPSPTSTPTPSATSTQTPTYTPTPSVVMPFIDSFDPKPRSEWDSFRGEWHGSDGHHFTGQLGYSERQIALVGDENWKNYRIEVTCFSYDINYPVMVVLRATHERYIIFQFSRYQGAKFITIEDGRETVIAAEPTTFTERFNAIYHFKVEVKDDVLTGFIEDTRILETQLTNTEWNVFPSGMVGVGYEPAAHLVWFDDFQVTELE